MKQSSRFISLSGLFTLFILIGNFAALKSMTGSYQVLNLESRFPFAMTTSLTYFIIMDSVMVLIFHNSFGLLLHKKANKQGLPLWDAMSFQTLLKMGVIPNNELNDINNSHIA
jgi:hypothetical protein